MQILFIGDVFGQPGRDALLRWLPGFKEARAVDFVIANGENAANGAGITSKIALRMLAEGVDVITTGNHVWRQKEVYSFLATDDRIVRPANYPAGAPGRGLTVRPAADGSEVADYFTPCSFDYACGGDPWYEFDPEAAKALLAEGLAEEGLEEFPETQVHLRVVDRS